LAADREPVLSEAEGDRLEAGDLRMFSYFSYLNLFQAITLAFGSGQALTPFLPEVTIRSALRGSGT
jgi:hypothetical protein